MIIYLNFCSLKVHNLVFFQCFSEQVYYKKNFGSFLVNFQFRAEVKKVTSRAELKNLQLELWLKPAWLALITRKQAFLMFYSFFFKFWLSIRASNYQIHIYTIFLVFWHPWHPCERVNSGKNNFQTKRPMWQ